MHVDLNKLMLIPLVQLAADAGLSASYHAFMAALAQRRDTHPKEQSHPDGFKIWSPTRIATRFNDYVQHQSSNPDYLPFLLVDKQAKVVIAETLLRAVPNRLPRLASPVTIVHPDHRNYGIGKIILLQTIQVAAQAGFTGLLMEAREDNPASWRRIERLVSAGLAQRLQDSGSGEHIFKNYQIDTLLDIGPFRQALLPQLGQASIEAPKY